jgi:hypothetical protein
MSKAVETEGWCQAPAHRDYIDIQRAESKQANAVTSEAAEKLLSAGDLKLHSPQF